MKVNIPYMDVTSIGLLKGPLPASSGSPGSRPDFQLVSFYIFSGSSWWTNDEQETLSWLETWGFDGFIHSMSSYLGLYSVWFWRHMAEVLTTAYTSPFFEAQQNIPMSDLWLTKVPPLWHLENLHTGTSQKFNLPAQKKTLNFGNLSRYHPTVCVYIYISYIYIFTEIIHICIFYILQYLFIPMFIILF